jgi:hypothetical protein
MNCDLSKGSVVVSGLTLQCNGTNQSSLVSLLRVTGASGSDSITITDSELTVLLTDVSVKSSIAFGISGSTVWLIAEDASTFESSGAAGIECSHGSNVTLGSIGGGSFSAVAGSEWPGIGAGIDALCHSVDILNGSVVAKGMTGIGTAFASRRESTIGTLTILNAIVTAAGSQGAGIDAG